MRGRAHEAHARHVAVARINDSKGPSRLVIDLHRSAAWVVSPLSECCPFFRLSTGTFGQCPVAGSSNLVRCGGTWQKGRTSGQSFAGEAQALSMVPKQVQKAGVLIEDETK